jgi:UDP-N-acetylglucosamine 4,6-dehydratase
MDWTNKVVLITGGSGFMGNLLCRYLLANHDVKKVISYSRRWHDSERLVASINDPRLRAINGDIKDDRALRTALNGVTAVIHSAAYKSLPSSEYNSTEAVKTNVIGSMTLIDAAIEEGVERVIGISTDKACDPISTYGRTKAVMESLFVTANNRGRTKFSVLRYGNVWGSLGSVVPFFQSLIENKQNELPVTDPSFTRYWFSPQNAVQYVLRCLCEMQGGETFVPKLKSSTIEQLVNAFQIAYPDRDIRMKVVGRRPGEKPHESMISSNEAYRTFDRDWTFVIEPEQRDWDANYIAQGTRVANEFVENSYAAERYELNELVDLIRG